MIDYAFSAAGNVTQRRGGMAPVDQSWQQAALAAAREIPSPRAMVQYLSDQQREVLVTSLLSDNGAFRVEQSVSAHMLRSLRLNGLMEMRGLWLTNHGMAVRRELKRMGDDAGL